MSAEPRIDLGSPRNVFCAAHLEPFRAGWPRGYAPMLLVLFQHAVRDEQILRACGWDPERGGQADIERLSAAVREFGPLCCRIDPEELARYTAMALADDLAPMMAELRSLEQAPSPAG